MKKYKFGVLGAGNMGTAIAEGAVRAGRFAPEQVLMFNRSEEKRAAHAAKGYAVTGDYTEVYAESEIVLLAVKPQNFDEILPNTTEAAILLDRDPASAPQNETEAQEWLHALHSRYGAQVVLTGLDYEPGKVGSGCLSADGGTISLHERIAQYYPGTGDLFAAVVLGALLNGRALADACALAGEFVKDCIAYTAAQHTDPMHGVQFEKLLPRLFSCHENRTEV